MKRVIEVTSKDVSWDWSSETPHYYATISGLENRSYVKLYPTPCYPHDAKLVAKTLAEVEATFKVKNPTTVFVFHYDIDGRTNGWTEYAANYTTKTEVCPIFLAGKRIPPMPSMTRYLVAHEYGHVVSSHLALAMFREKEDEYTSHNPRRRMYEEYTKIRCPELVTPAYYGPMTWHASLPEIFANDFRILVAGKEPEFWPHPVEYPTKVKKLVSWWKKAVKQHGA
jgi:hypothetical protein